MANVSGAACWLSTEGPSCVCSTISSAVSRIWKVLSLPLLDSAPQIWFKSRLLMPGSSSRLSDERAPNTKTAAE